MKLNLYTAILATGIVLTSSPALAELSEAAQLRLQCEEERQQKLAPLRKEQIEECMVKSNSRENCDQKYRDFGNAGRTATGGLRPRMFDDLPACVAAREAELVEEAAQRQERKKSEGARDTAPGATRDSPAATKTRDSSTATTKRDTAPGKSRDSSAGTTTRGSSTGTSQR